jgi:hypothetical protein
MGESEKEMQGRAMDMVKRKDEIVAVFTLRRDTRSSYSSHNPLLGATPRSAIQEQLPR